MSWQSCLIQATAVVLILLCAITSGKVNIVEREHNLDNRLINDRCILLLVGGLLCVNVAHKNEVKPGFHYPS